MKKILLSSAIAAALGTAGIANAAVNLDAALNAAPNNVVLPLLFATEASVNANTTLDVTAAGTAGAGNNAGAAAVVKRFGFTIGQGTSKYVRLSFSHPLAGNLTALSDFTHETAGAGATPAQITVSQGGAAGDDFVILEVAAAADTDVLQSDRFLFNPAPGVISAANKADQFIKYAMYETAVDAINQANPLHQSANQRWITWGPGYALGCTTANPLEIDVVDTTQFIGGGLTTNVANLDLSATNAYTPAGVPVTIAANYFGAGAKVVLAGSTSAFETANGFTLNGTNADVAPADGEAIWTAAVGADELNGVFAVNADGTDNMDASSYSISITDAGNATYDVGTITTACGSLQFSGSTDRLDFALTPGGVFQQMVRITNPSTSAGPVTVTVINDDGDDVTFDLGDIAGIDSSVLGAKASTKLIDINDIYAAAQAKDSSFAIAEGASNKLRVVVRGSFGGDAREGVAGGVSAGERLVDRREDGIYIQGLTVSRNKDAFFQTK